MYRRVDTLMEKMEKKKAVKLDATFYPKKRKRVLNKRALILNKKTPVSQSANRQRSPVVKPKTAPDSINALDSQPSISASLFKTPVDDLLDSQCSLSSSFLDFSQSQTVRSNSPVQQAAQQPSKCTLACYFCSCMLCVNTYIQLRLSL